MAVTDASLAANLAHGVLFVVGAEMTSRRIAQRAVEQLEMGQARFLGAVLNRVDLEHNAYYYSRYYRSDYGGYYGPTNDAASGGGQSANSRRGGASAPSRGGKAARTAAGIGAIGLASLVDARMKLAQNLRFGRHSS
jgi:hypothetical protein